MTSQLKVSTVTKILFSAWTKLLLDGYWMRKTLFKAFNCESKVDFVSTLNQFGLEFKVMPVSFLISISWVICCSGELSFCTTLLQEKLLIISWSRASGLAQMTSNTRRCSEWHKPGGYATFHSALIKHDVKRWEETIQMRTRLCGGDLLLITRTHRTADSFLQVVSFPQ